MLKRAAMTGTNSQRTLVRIIVREDHTSIFRSVYLQPAIELAERGWNVHFVLFSFLGQWLRRQPRQLARELDKNILAGVGKPVIRLPLPPARLEHLWAPGTPLKLWFKRKYQFAEDAILEGNNSEATFAAIAARGKQTRHKIVYRCWGIDEEEFLYALSGQCERDKVPPRDRKKAAALFQRQLVAVQQSDHIVCVSHAMADHLVRRFGGERNKMSVIPCGVDTKPFQEALPNRDQMRRRLGVQDKWVLVYCGALQRYQMPDEGVRLFAELKRELPNAFFLALTPEPEKMQQICERMQLPRDSVSVLSLPHDQVAQYLVAADAGLLLRQECAVNRVASPVKFGEYLAAGLPVVISAGIGDYSRLVSEKQLGVVLDSLPASRADVKKVVALAQRKEITTPCLAAAQMLDVKCLTNKLDSVLGSVCAASPDFQELRK